MPLFAFTLYSNLNIHTSTKRKKISFIGEKPVNIALCFAPQVFWLLIAKADALKGTQICQVCQKASRPLGAFFTMYLATKFSVNEIQQFNCKQMVFAKVPLPTQGREVS